VRRPAALLAAGALLLASAAARADRRTDLEAVRRAIEESRARVADFESRERGVLEAVDALDRAAALLAGEVAAAREGAQAARLELAALEGEAARLAQQLAVTQRALRARAVALYRTGEVGAVRVLFSADGLPEFLARVSALRRLLEHDGELLARRRAEAAAVAEARLRARASAERLAAAEAELAERSAALEEERSRKRGLVARLHADRTRERDALVELERAARALEETLESLGEAPDAGERPLPGPPFLALRRRLAPPVDAPIALGFGRQVDPLDGTETFHSGVVFEAPLGTPVRAVAAGRVRFAGWFRGYGRLAIVDHGGGYFSVAGHLDELRVEVGSLVQAGEEIGSVGETGSLAGPRLYFEIRRGGEALDPRDWLRGPPAS
jgi:septal ring factor EnvC (AmiA/AmiB activator)